MELSDLRSMIQDMTDEELQDALKDIRQNRRTPMKPKAETTTTAKPKKEASSISLDALLASAKANPAIAAQLLAALQGGKK